ncbi:RagB/SusD family nutrient uptake outer membrane protein [Dyadobacter tibetensis]|uniref:RagB/SusD family nutrient uptake outer membrane protein n=1 Tax=Dyadobacter tibetensis TaxID=1211851 RepID=UPI000472A1ED|nr:RagB/SusD family nutrient uptake outer membrane protein [Dyadobacter tibetensis]
MKISSLIRILILLPVFWISSCNEEAILKEIPLDFASPENAFVTKEDFDLAVNALYDLTRGILSDGEHRPLDYIYGTDLGYNAAQQLNERFGSYPATLTPNSEQARFHWQQYYKIISSANIILNRLETSSLGQDQKVLIQGKSRLFRGLAYRNLTHLYGGVPLELEEVTTDKKNYVRASREESYLQAVEDLAFAAENLPEIDKVKDGEITNLAALHLLAETYLALQQFDKAVQAASLVIDDPNTALMTSRFGSRSTEPGDVYWDLFRRSNQNRSAGNKEGIWVFQYEVDLLGGVIKSSAKEGPQLERDCAPRPYSFPYKDPAGITPFLSLGVSDYTGGRGIGRFRGTDHFVYGIWTLDWKDMRNSEYNFVRDVKFNNPASEWYGRWISEFDIFKQRTDDTIRNFYPYQSKVTTPGNHPLELFVDPILKTLNASSAGTTYTDQYFIRLAETYLIRAEAYLGMGNTSLAAEDINIIRKRAQAKLVTPAQVSISFILDERMRELGVEEKRRLTLNRLGLLYDRTSKYCNGHPTAAKFGVDVAPYHNVFPIPYSEIERNTGAILEQNPGYAN